MPSSSNKCLSSVSDKLYEWNAVLFFLNSWISWDIVCISFSCLGKLTWQTWNWSKILPKLTLRTHRSLIESSYSLIVSPEVDHNGIDQGSLLLRDIKEKSFYFFQRKNAGNFLKRDKKLGKNCLINKKFFLLGLLWCWHVQ